MKNLPAFEYERFLDRFSRFGDAVIREVHTCWRPHPRCRMTIDAMDRQHGHAWVIVELELVDLALFHWWSSFRGSIECGELLLREFGDRVYLAVGGESSSCTEVGEFSSDRTSMMAIGRSVRYEIRETH